MKKIYSLILCMVMVFTLCSVISTNVKADEATLSELRVEAQNLAGERTDVKLTPEFSADVTEYKATVANDTIKLVLTPTTTEEDARCKTEWEALDVGDNKTYITVTAADGTKTKYTISTRRMTEEEEATYKPEKEKTSDEKVTVKVAKKEMTISSAFKESDIPEGFVKTKAEYDGKEFVAIKGEKKNIVAFWLKPVAGDTEDALAETEEATDAAEESETEGAFYIYNEEAGNFYKMSNIYVKSRMYTIVNVSEPDSFLDDYETSNIDMVGENVKAWVLDAANSLYLVYAMNWDGNTSLYCYDDIEKCFQRYIIDSAAATQVEAANEAINTLQDKNNELIKKYNESNGTKWKIIAVLLILIVILFFVVLNLALSLESRKITGGEKISDENKKKRKERKNEDTYLSEQEEYSEEEDELFKLVEDDDDDFIILNEKNNIADKRETTEQQQDDEFELGMDEIDISDQIMKEMEENKDKTSAVSEENKQPFVAEKGEPFNEEDLKDVLSTAFPSENNDEDEDVEGFTFI